MYKDDQEYINTHHDKEAKLLKGGMKNAVDMIACIQGQHKKCKKVKHIFYMLI